MKISRRLANGWADRVENRDRERCDIDGAKLWIGPGDQIYCNLVHESENVESQDLVEGKKTKA